MSMRAFVASGVLATVACSSSARPTAPRGNRLESNAVEPHTSPAGAPSASAGPAKRQPLVSSPPVLSEQGASDRDGDGQLDAEDSCPGDPEDRDGFQDEDGCPDPDNDADGVLDADDLCPNDPEDRDGFQDGDGCPDLDDDQDRILDVDDKCPREPENYNGKDDDDGCPDRSALVVTEGPAVNNDKILFAEGSAVVGKGSEPVLDAVARMMRNYPEIAEVTCTGVASAAETNAKQLAQRRARAVRQALQRRGVAAKRLKIASQIKSEQAQTSWQVRLSISRRRR
jgi:outer membrane protein OmpA-like peptidoglycan-associated protein